MYNITSRAWNVANNGKRQREMTIYRDDELTEVSGLNNDYSEDKRTDNGRHECQYYGDKGRWGHGMDTYVIVFQDSGSSKVGDVERDQRRFGKAMSNSICSRMERKKRWAW